VNSRDVRRFAPRKLRRLLRLLLRLPLLLLRKPSPRAPKKVKRN
jgi:hypothetical protein